ncbi:MAG: alpha/beta hydrolase [Armatimonadetes bacterium]|nr:alpha/beta hydrolase [Armatimonadota bacterium]
MSGTPPHEERNQRGTRAGREQPLFLESGGSRLFALLHNPTPQPPESSSQPPKAAFVFCPPFAEEEKSSHRTFVDLARRLCDAGCAVLLIQYRGCGDSEGEFDDFLCADWREDIRAGLNFLRESTRAPLGLLGLRVGATLAAEVAEEAPEVSRLVLWEPILSGKQYMSLNLRRKLLRKMLTDKEGSLAAKADETSAVNVVSVAPEERESGIDFEGYWITDQLQSEVASIDLLAEIQRFKGGVLITQISSQSTPGKAVQSLEGRYRQAGAQVETHAVVEQPIWNLMDLFTAESLVQHTLEWITAR